MLLIKGTHIGDHEHLPARSDETVGGEQARSGRDSNTSDYVRDLIRRDQEQALNIANMQARVTEGMDSGPGKSTMEELREAARKEQRQYEEC